MYPKLQQFVMLASVQILIENLNQLEPTKVLSSPNKSRKLFFSARSDKLVIHSKYSEIHFESYSYVMTGRLLPYSTYLCTSTDLVKMTNSGVIKISRARKKFVFQTFLYRNPNFLYLRNMNIFSKLLTAYAIKNMSMGKLLPIFPFQKLIIKVEQILKYKDALFLKCKPMYGIATSQKEYNNWISYRRTAYVHHVNKVFLFSLLLNQFSSCRKVVKHVTALHLLRAP